MGLNKSIFYSKKKSINTVGVIFWNSLETGAVEKEALKTNCCSLISLKKRLVMYIVCHSRRLGLMALEGVSSF